MAKKKQTDTSNQMNKEQTPTDSAATDNTQASSIQLTVEQFEELKANIEKIQTEREEYLQVSQRVQADFDNYRKRNATLRADSLEEGRRDTIKELLCVLDSFERALQATEECGSQDAFVEGMMMVYKLFKDQLAKLGLEEIPAENQMFDPLLHDAVMQSEQEGVEGGTIIEVMQKGYQIKDKIIRYSMVKVAL